VVDAGVVLDGVAEPVAFEALGPGRVQIEFNRLDSLSDEEFGEEFRYADDDDVQTDDDQTEDGAEHEQEDRA
jgi:ribosome maturation factor RimP